MHTYRYITHRQPYRQIGGNADIQNIVHRSSLIVRVSFLRPEKVRVPCAAQIAIVTASDTANLRTGECRLNGFSCVGSTRKRTEEAAQRESEGWVVQHAVVGGLPSQTCKLWSQAGRKTATLDNLDHHDGFSTSIRRAAFIRRSGLSSHLQKAWRFG